MPAPMPLEPPVTRATLPLNDFACIGHQNPPSHLLCQFWIVLSRMTVQRDSFPGCPTRPFFLCFGSRSEFTDNVKRLQRTERLDTEAKDLTLRSFIFAVSLTCSYLNPIGRFLNEHNI